ASSELLSSAAVFTARGRGCAAAAPTSRSRLTIANAVIALVITPRRLPVGCSIPTLLDAARRADRFARGHEYQSRRSYSWDADRAAPQVRRAEVVAVRVELIDARFASWNQLEAWLRQIERLRVA